MSTLFRLNNLHKILLFNVFLHLTTLGFAQESLTLTTSELRDKIKGAWAAQTIGVTYGFPVEFRFNSARVPDDHELPWYDGYLYKMFSETPNIYDDIYMDLSFVQVFEDEGLDAPASSFANSFAHAGYNLWFANQVSRYNILNGLTPPESGHWLNNPAADDIDFQIEADFAGLMAPGMANSAIEVSDKIGHIMNYGDGWYGGVFIAVMYSLAFTTDDIESIISQAIAVIPDESDFHKVIDDVIALHQENPQDWKVAWEGIHNKWAHTDLGPRGLMSPFNIDAKINAAWVVLGLLYGNGDFGKTIDIAARAGDDADCNPASAAGILGTIYGYDQIPAYWKQGLKEVEDLDFAHTTISLNQAYEMSFKHALQMIQREGGIVTDQHVTIRVQKPKTVPFEDSFENHHAKELRSLATGEGRQRELLEIKESYIFDFEGVGFAVMGAVRSTTNDDYTFNAELRVDGKLVETASLPTNYLTRRFYLFWKYALVDGPHKVEINITNPTDNAQVLLDGLAIYGSEPTSFK